MIVSPAATSNTPTLYQHLLGSAPQSLNDRLLRTGLDLLGLHELDEVYRSSIDSSQDNKNSFCRSVLDRLGIETNISPDDLARLPATGASIVVANHPYGGIEGLVLDDLLHTVRPDVKIMANYVLGKVPELRNAFILVDPFDTTSNSKNQSGIKEALAWLKDGHMLAIFPAGEVSSFSLRHFEVRDNAWSQIAQKLATRTDSSVTPLYFEGCNSPLFQALGMLHPRIRTALLIRELLNKRGHSLTLHIGNRISSKRLKEFNDPEEATQFIRSRTYVLKHRNTLEPERADAWLLGESRESAGATMGAAAGGEHALSLLATAEEKPQLLLQAEVTSLPASNLLIAQAHFEVYHASREQIPHLLHEIGRLREITFRGVGEGTGKAIDLDRFDDHYSHVFVWNRDTCEVVGAYRMGLTDKILEAHGVEGFYTSTLFKFRKELFNAINPAIELGRSFVRKEYQRSFAPLLMLWKGILEFVSRNPEYKMVFGPVSISNEYRYGSRKLMVEFLKENAYDEYLAKFVRARTPMKGQNLRYFDLAALWCLESEIDEVSSIIAELEGNQKGVPILLKQYLKLGGKILGFNVDPGFQNSLDSLIMVDLTHTDPERLAQYMGKEKALAFLETHGVTEPIVAV